jgi:hypothetical protein
MEALDCHLIQRDRVQPMTLVSLQLVVPVLLPLYHHQQ